ncbi:uncharacterized protein LOC128547895 [Mercenaria mercenaria]|uniref:uncharacterized protein LOC128547895 n=1 Tax=Mercenaria mercenaria TaxID=6596 RepID=UPI00234E478B|nr:uncharacterized protein LOC128547895 [Mercenaria mercenaria]XP_053377579.1 uncharacterized protein LOC128547895 [Mercenaria mercenaria]
MEIKNITKTVITLLWLWLICTVSTQPYKRPDVQPPADNQADCVCQPDITLCKCTFVVEHRLSMVLHEERELVRPEMGFLSKVSNGMRLTDEETERVITTDGVDSRLVIAINGKFPGPRVEVFENQEIEITVVNKFHTDSVTVHFHGIHQKNTPWMDGVAFVTQCPILPGQSFVYRFKAYPPGTSFYHAHIGDQRSMGLYGPFIVRKRDTEPISEIVVTLQDWNHNMDAETAYLRMITEQYDSYNIIPTTYSIDRGNFSRFEFQSGLVNGKGRYWRTINNHNSAPLERFHVQTGTLYRFRVIGAMTLYPMRVYIEGHTLSLRSSDCFNLKNTPVQSIIVHPGERYDFHVTFQDSSAKKQYLLIAETIEIRESHGKYHAAEAIIEVDNAPGTVDLYPNNDKAEFCTIQSACKVFNCPYGYSGTSIRSCLNYNDVQNTDPLRDPSKVKGNKVDNEYFFNFAFPGFPGNTPGSVNGRQFISPTSPLLTQPNALTTRCNEEKCRRNGICSCTYIVEIPGNKLIQMTFMNIGNGSGWSHPVHLHGTSFFVMKMGFGTYDATNGQLVNETSDIRCTGSYGFCSQAVWRNNTWRGGNIPEQNPEPPIKDTVVVPTGGYVVIRFISDNPGMWFLHCHIDLHNTNGMGMVININPGNHPKLPTGFPTCGNFLNNGQSQPDADKDCPVSIGAITRASFGIFVFLITIIITF